MARAITFSGELKWPLADGKQEAKLDLSTSLAYTEYAAVEDKYTSPVTDESVPLHMTSAKFLLIRCSGEDLSVKLNGGSAIGIKKDTGFIVLWNSGGAITSLSVTAATVPATLNVLAFS